MRREKNENCGTSWFLSPNLVHMFNKKPFLKNQILHTRILSNILLSWCRTPTYMCTVWLSRHDLTLHRAICFGNYIRYYDIRYKRYHFLFYKLLNLNMAYFSWPTFKTRFLSTCNYFCEDRVPCMNKIVKMSTGLT